jgi:hypothetical protein
MKVAILLGFQEWGSFAGGKRLFDGKDRGAFPLQTK